MNKPRFVIRIKQREIAQSDGLTQFGCWECVVWPWSGISNNRRKSEQHVLNSIRTRRKERARQRRSVSMGTWMIDGRRGRLGKQNTCSRGCLLSWKSSPRNDSIRRTFSLYSKQRLLGDNPINIYRRLFLIELFYVPFNFNLST